MSSSRILKCNAIYKGWAETIIKIIKFKDIFNTPKIYTHVNKNNNSVCGECEMPIVLADVQQQEIFATFRGSAQTVD
jgi:hypothetical protein